MKSNKSTLKTFYNKRLETKDRLTEVINELEIEYNDLKSKVEAINYNVPPRVLMSLGTKKELLEDAKEELKNFNR